MKNFEKAKMKMLDEREKTALSEIAMVYEVWYSTLERDYSDSQKQDLTRLLEETVRTEMKLLGSDVSDYWIDKELGVLKFRSLNRLHGFINGDYLV